MANQLDRRFIAILKRPDRNTEHHHIERGNRRTGEHIPYPRRPLLAKKTRQKKPKPHRKQISVEAHQPPGLRVFTQAQPVKIRAARHSRPGLIPPSHSTLNSRNPPGGSSTGKDTTSSCRAKTWLKSVRILTTVAHIL